MGWWDPVVEAGNTAGLDGKQFLYNPAGAAVKDLRNRFGSGPAPSTYASDTFAQLTRQQYADYVSNIQPLEDRLNSYATDQTLPGKAMEEAGGMVRGAFDRQAGANSRRLRGLGLTLNEDEQQASTRSLDLSRGLAEVDAMNNARDQVTSRQRSLLGNPAPQVSALMGGR